MTDVEAAREHLREAQILVERLGARRFEAYNLHFLAKIFRMDGRRAEAYELCEKAMVISRETGVGFMGPRVLAELALNTDDPVVRREALLEGEEILREGAVSHNHFYFYADGMDAYLDSKEWDEVDRYAAALEAFTRPEPLPWCDFFIKRGRILAAYGRGNREDSTIQELRRLRNEAEHVGLRMALPALDAALGDTSC